ncbi:DUF4314 domain-containing protein [Anaerocolumna sedimenticola]|uniref:DUF4314 domain-containing protein n=1 Tax=Anaerocolumna sedimenticola TaxID=2696063 RepID=A0A6P1TTB1_9FIRM|nr:MULTISPECIES: DUF4314 domain-containing protein [Anaerocolumna]QHQ63449.1 DUF4314 domain-containing protein [Anaerocolumna sedimenticola]
MRGISADTLKRLKDSYIPGTRVVLIEMNDPYTKLMTGDKGTVTGVDDIGTIHVKWDRGGSLGVVFGEDSCRKIDD